MPGDRARRVAHLRSRLAMQPLRDRPHRASARPVSIQQSARRVPGLRRDRPDDGARPGPNRSRPVPNDPLGRDCALVDPRLIAATSMICSRSPPSSTSPSTSRSICSTDPDRAARRGRPRPRFRRPEGLLSRARGPHAPASEPPVRESIQAARGLPGVSRCAAEARGARRQDRGADIAELSAMTIRDLTVFDPPAGVASATGRRPRASWLRSSIGSATWRRSGSTTCTLDRPASNLAAGELKRVILTRTLGSGLVNTLYVLDEPTSGLHPHDVGRLIELLHRLATRETPSWSSSTITT